MNQREANPILKCRPFRVRPMAWAVLLFLSFWIPNTPAQETGFGDLKQFDVFFGFNGYASEGRWYPVTFEVENQGPTFTAIFELEPEQFGQGEVHRLAVELPTGTLKRFTMPLYANTSYGKRWRVAMRDRTGNVLEELNSQFAQVQLSWGTHLMGALPATAPGMPEFPKSEQNNPEFQPSVALMQVEMFPENPLLLEGLDSIYLNATRAASFRVPQTEALLTWLHGGGHLILASDSPGDINGVPWLKGILPMDVQSGGILDMSAEDIRNWIGRRELTEEDRRVFSQQNNPIANLYKELSETDDLTGRMPILQGPLRDGTVELTLEGAPLVVSADRGRGRITLLTVNPELEPLRSWKGLPVFWARLVDLSPTQLARSNIQYSRFSIDGVFGAMVDSKQIRKLPVSWLLALLVVYLLVIGPLDQYWLKKINRQMLTWITFPCYVIAFSVLIYVIGYKLRAGETEWNELQIVDVLPKGSTGAAELRGTTYAAVYSPVNDRYPVAAGSQTAALRNEYSGSGVGGAGGGAEILHNGFQYQAELSVPVWTSQLYVNEWFESAPLPIESSLRLNVDGDWTLQLKNNLTQPIGEARLFWKGRVYDIESIAAGETRPVVLNQLSSTSINEFLEGRWSLFEQAARQRQQAVGQDTARNLLNRPLDSMAASIIPGANSPHVAYREMRAPRHLNLHPYLEQGRPVLMAWSENHAAVDPLNQFSPRRSELGTLYRLVMNSPEP